MLRIEFPERGYYSRSSLLINQLAKQSFFRCFPESLLYPCAHIVLLFLSFSVSISVPLHSPACAYFPYFYNMPMLEKENIRCCTYTINGEELWLLPGRAVWWPARRILLLADVHLGKSTHFRQKGVNAPVQVLYDDIAALDELVNLFGAQRVIVLGDLFHASENDEWQVFGEWLLSQPAKWELIRGNHDLLSFEAYERYNVTVYEKALLEAPFLLTHHPLDHFDHVPPGYYVLAGHVHPAVLVKGKAYQSLRVSCFYFGERQGLLPAFGRFTGCELIEPAKKDNVFVIAGDRVLPYRY